ncbi:hypothetical protein ADICYQ_4012 [Cyclobacterium qasimii M12-11B]|uniref:Uncharacterized protein n=1 Tax=Cyclobacterium qasimii M12-11B TaxID=641524 RepID=S7VAF5_9BACT|nr:hypothetical protein ADICYQ_4012 [Cyclobacterium qasimii M12-11B]
MVSMLVQNKMAKLNKKEDTRSMLYRVYLSGNEAVIIR